MAGSDLLTGKIDRDRDMTIPATGVIQVVHDSHWLPRELPMEIVHLQ
jgi:hypothetical protein